LKIGDAFVNVNGKEPILNPEPYCATTNKGLNEKFIWKILGRTIKKRTSKKCGHGKDSKNEKVIRCSER
jgi:hypothetical protein